jgi:2-dehydro-3-deoxygalactonokinase
LRAAQLLGFEARGDGADRLSGLLIGTEIADAAARFGQPRSLRLLRAGHLGQLYEMALRERGFDVTADDAEQASRRGLGRAAINIWGAQF